MGQMEEYLKEAVNVYGASDIFVVAGREISFRIHDLVQGRTEASLKAGEMKVSPKLFDKEVNELVDEIYQLAGRDKTHFNETGDDDFSFALRGVSRFRVNAYKQRGTQAAVIRVIRFDLPDYRDLGIPETVIELADEQKGMVLVTGPAGSGKSTTLACIVDAINKNYNKHIITLEDPVEFLHRHDKSVISQREVRLDTANYVTALRASLRQSPDVILLGEMRDTETISTAMTAAETGHLVLSTLHTIGAANTIDRIIDSFPAAQQHQIALQFSMVITAIVSMQLVPTVDGRLAAAFEVMKANPAIRNMIRESKIPQIEGQLYASDTPDMLSMDTSLYKLYKEGVISDKTALEFASKPEMLGRKL